MVYIYIQSVAKYETIDRFLYFRITSVDHSVRLDSVATHVLLQHPPLTFIRIPKYFISFFFTRIIDELL